MSRISKLLVYIFLMLFPALAWGDAGVLIPRSVKSEPDDSILSMDKMDVYIDLNNQYSDVRIIQIYKNHTGNTLEGEYIFTMPDGAKISDFAIWEDYVRIPGVIMEKMKAREIYERITSFKRDPGLLETTDVKSVVNRFSCKVFPIPPYGTKRVEINYKLNLDFNDLKTYFMLPLKPNMHGSQKVGELHLEFEVKCGYPIRDFQVRSKTLQPKLEVTENLVRGTANLSNYTLSEDFIFTYMTDIEKTFYDILTHRDVERVHADISPANGKNYQDDSGYFLVKTIFDFPAGEESGGRNIVFVIDTSLSMLFDKLDRACESFNYFMERLKESDRFNLLIFNDNVTTFAPELRPATPQNVQAAREFFYSGYISGGTDLRIPFRDAFEMLREEGDNYVVFISDGYPTIGDLRLNEIKKEIMEMNGGAAKIFPFGIGDDTNKYFLEELAKESDGYFNFISSTESNMIKGEIFFNKIGGTLIEDVRLAYDSGNIYDMYPNDIRKAFNRTSIDYVGKYREPAEESFGLKGKYKGTSFEYGMSCNLPAVNRENGHLRRMWAELRVEHLLKKIRLEGETREMVKEVIALAKQFKFVTPYTSFLAAPRSILRPRVIKPGDPVLKVEADESIVEIIAIFPFGLTKKMDYIQKQGIFKTRFLVPSDVADGEYFCRLILKDVSGNVYKEKKSFIVDNSAPEIKIEAKGEVSPGEIVKIKVYADSDTKHLSAKFPYSQIVSLKYDAGEKASVGYLKISDGISSGSYRLKVTATDFAHNCSAKEIDIWVKSL